jgi:hypothetical protein
MTPTQQVLKRIVDLGLELRFEDDYEWCMFCDAGVYHGGLEERSAEHFDECPLVLAFAENGMSL